MAKQTVFLYIVTQPMDWAGAGFKSEEGKEFPPALGDGFMPIFTSYDRARSLHPEANIEETRQIAEVSERPAEPEAPVVEAEEVETAEA